MSAPCSERTALFETARLSVRCYRVEDRTEHDVLRADPVVQRFMHWPAEEDFDALLCAGSGRKPPDGEGWINMAVVSRETGALAGDHGLNVDTGCACLGLALMPSLRRRGLGRELVLGSMGWLRAHGVTRFRAEIDFGNAASFGLFFALGYRLVADRVDGFGHYSVLECDVT